MLRRIEVRGGPPQGIVLVPTCELAIQVAEAFQRYASKMRGFHVPPKPLRKPARRPPPKRPAAKPRCGS